MKTQPLLPELEHSSAHGLAHLLEAIIDDEDTKLPEAPEGVFHYFLETPLSEWMTDPELLRSFLQSSGAGLNEVITVRECLACIKPPFELLGIIRDQTRKYREEKPSEAVVEASTALYFCTFASELNAYRSTKTRLSQEELKRGLAWTQQLSWLPTDLQGVLGHSLAQL